MPFGLAHTGVPDMAGFRRFVRGPPNGAFGSSRYGTKTETTNSSQSPFASPARMFVPRPPQRLSLKPLRTFEGIHVDNSAQAGYSSPSTTVDDSNAPMPLIVPDRGAQQSCLKAKDDALNAALACDHNMIACEEKCQNVPASQVGSCMGTCGNCSAEWSAYSNTECPSH